MSEVCVDVDIFLNGLFDCKLLFMMMMMMMMIKDHDNDDDDLR